MSQRDIVHKCLAFRPNIDFVGGILRCERARWECGGLQMGCERIVGIDKRLSVVIVLGDKRG